MTAACVRTAVGVDVGVGVRTEVEVDVGPAVGVGVAVGLGVPVPELIESIAPMSGSGGVKGKPTSIPAKMHGDEDCRPKLGGVAVGLMKRGSAAISCAPALWPEMEAVPPPARIPRSS